MPAAIQSFPGAEPSQQLGLEQMGQFRDEVPRLVMYQRRRATAMSSRNRSITGSLGEKLEVDCISRIIHTPIAYKQFYYCR
jgi:hypothetical protein